MERLNRIFEIARLIAKEKTDKLSDSESKKLRKWLAENDGNKEIYKKHQEGKSFTNELQELKKFDELKAFKKVEQLISTDSKHSKVYRLVPNLMKYAAAVAMLIICSYLIVTKINKPETGNYAENTILPGQQKAILITADKQEIALGISNKLQIIQDELANIANSGSTLSYTKNDSIDNTNIITAYNTLITNRGGEYNLILSDSTEVMLNSESKLKYPVVFTNKIREVELEGEAFFKVSKSKKIPFIVKVKDVNVTVYGTVFNVSAYSNENIIQTTLVEGSVGVTLNNTKSESEIIIKPGQQLSYNKGTGETEKKEVNAEQFIAWTQGKFEFENEPIEEILKVMSRWYNFDYNFKDESLKKQCFTLSLERYDDVNKILDMISTSSVVKFSIKDNSIIVYSE